MFGLITKRKIFTQFFGHQGYSPWFFSDFGSEKNFPQIAYISPSPSILHVWTVKHLIKSIKNAGKAIQNTGIAIQIGRCKSKVCNFSLRQILRKPHHLVQYELLYLLVYTNVDKCPVYDEETQINDSDSRFPVNYQSITMRPFFHSSFSIHKRINDFENTSTHFQLNLLT